MNIRSGAHRYGPAWQALFELLRPELRRFVLALGVVLVQQASGLVLPYSAKILVDDIIGRHETGKLLPLALAILGATVVQCLTGLALGRLVAEPGARIAYELRLRIQRHIGQLPLSFFDANQTGTLVARVMRDVESVRNLLGIQIMQFLGGVAMTIAAIVILTLISPPITLLVCTFACVYAYFSWRALLKVRPLLQKRQVLYSGVNGRLNESFARIRVTKTFHAEEREATAFEKDVRSILDNVLTTMTRTGRPNLAATLLIGAVGAAVWFVGARQIFSGTLTPGELVMMVMFFAFLVNPISEIVGIGTQLGEVFAGMARANEVLCTPRETDNPARRHAMGTIRGDIAFENVQFSYDGKRPAVQGVSFVAPAGTVTALVGPSGAGKSTITLLLAAFHEPQGGRITVDGLNLTTIRLDTYRSQLGIVLQDDFLFAGSIAENVAYARPSASQEAILDACRAAHIDEFAERFEHKYDTHVGELGGLLSRGQRQRIAIARALLANPRILILDEPTSTLDAESERYVQESLRKLMAGRTTFVIAHRLATIRHADRILFIENGHVVESGTHESLIKLGRRYSQLHRQQLVIEREFLTTLPDEPQREEVPEKRQTS